MNSHQWYRWWLGVKQVTNPYTNQSWCPWLWTPYGVTRPQWVNTWGHSRFGGNLTCVLLKHTPEIDILSNSSEITGSGEWMPQDVADNSTVNTGQWIRSALVKIMACHLFGAKSLSKPMLLLIRPLGTNFNETLIKIQNFSFMKMHLKRCLRNGGHFVQGEMS